METVKSIPEARLLLSSLRSVGYSEEAAIADLIDNCIAAKANEIKIDFDWESQRVVIVDNGIGMSQADLYENMRIGSSDPEKKRQATDLGRFGMGMKTAAFSLGKKLCVVTKNNGVSSNATWDLDLIPDIGWQLVIQSNEKIANQLSQLDGENGTVVVIENLDRIIDSSDLSKAKKHFYSIIRKVESHLSLVFHRFMSEDGLQLSINGTPIKPWDPFISDNSATQELPEEYVWSEDTKTEVLIQPYVLPHKTKFASEQLYQEAGGPKGWNFHQGVYVYRNRRLIICGTWFDFIKKEPAFNLARIRVDISSDGDADWKIDIKKSSAALPTYAREAVERSVEICTEASAKVYNSRGSYSKNNVTAPNLNYVWEQRKRNGKYSFHINKKHKLLNDIRKQLDDDGRVSLSAYISLVENFAPFVQSGLVDAMRSTSSGEGSLEEDVELEEIKTYIACLRKAGLPVRKSKTHYLIWRHIGI